MPAQLDPQQTPSTQNPLRHSVGAAHGWPVTFRQAPLPLQVLPTPHSLSGSLPMGITPQVPSTPPVRTASQARQVVVQAVAQQTSSTQKPLRHSPGSVQASPAGFFAVQVMPLQ
jgi:hypothetical protein